MEGKGREGDGREGEERGWREGEGCKPGMSGTGVQSCKNKNNTFNASTVADPGIVERGGCTTLGPK